MTDGDGSAQRSSGQADGRGAWGASLYSLVAGPKFWSPEQQGSSSECEFVEHQGVIWGAAAKYTILRPQLPFELSL